MLLWYTTRSACVLILLYILPNYIFNCYQPECDGVFFLKRPTFRYNEYSSNGTVDTLIKIWVNSIPRFGGLEITGLSPTTDYFSQVQYIWSYPTQYPAAGLDIFASFNLHCSI